MKRLIIIPFWFISLMVISQTVTLIEGETYVNSDASWNGVEISRATEQLLTFRNNSITSVNTSGYMLRSGDDGYYASQINNLDSAVITGNIFDWNGTPGATLCHGIMAGYSINYTIKYNYIDGSYYGIVHEGGYDDGTTMTNTAGGICYNIFKNCPTPLLTMGQSNTRIYNNTFYHSLSNSNGLVRIRESNGTATPAPSEDVKVKNNIFYSVYNHAAIDIKTIDVGFECDYNVYYWENTVDNKPHFEIADTSVTWDEWRALGYDEHSVIIDPGFVDLVDFIPSVLLGYGVDLGSVFEYGLSPTAEWVVDEYPDTIQQPTTWQVGAIVLGDDSMGDYFVAPWGDDDGVGTIGDPWATWGKAFNADVIQPGDTVYFRGGVYMFDPSGGKIYAGGYEITIDGEEGNYIHFFNYQGEEPILDCTPIVFDGDFQSAVFESGLYYVKFRGLTIRNLWSAYEGVDFVPTQIWRIYGAVNVTWENCTAYNSHGAGWNIWNSWETYLINCDSYNHCDSLDDYLPGNSGGGFYMNSPDTSTSLYFKDCRAWNCSDDGFGGYSNGYIEYDGCWSFFNGQLEGGGNGWKLGWLTDTKYSLQKTVKNCIAAFNRATGFTTNDLNYENVCWMNLYNNTVYHNGYFPEWDIPVHGFKIYNTGGTDEHELKRVYRNNISYDNEAGEIAVGTGAIYTHSNNTWDSEVEVTDADFVNELDSATIVNALLAERKYDGSLPDFEYFNLASGSDLVDAGMDVGLPYEGTAPDLGAFQYTAPGEAVLPNVITGDVYSVSTTRATIAGNSNDDGGGTVTSKGVCWNTTGTPTVSDNKTNHGGGTGEFNATVTGLTPNTTYYVRAYAINEIGTDYGDEVSLTTANKVALKLNDLLIYLNGKLIKL